VIPEAPLEIALRESAPREKAPREKAPREMVHEPAPPVPLRAPRVPEAPPLAAVSPEPAPVMYAENGRLRLSGAAFEQIQRRQSRPSRSSVSNKIPSPPAYLDRERAV